MTSQDHCTRELGGRNGSGCIDSRAKRPRHKVKIFFTSTPRLHMWCRVMGSALNIRFPQQYLHYSSSESLFLTRASADDEPAATDVDWKQGAAGAVNCRVRVQKVN